MRMRRLELAILAITLAFGFFIGGFFTGRSHRALSVTAVAAQTQDSPGVLVSVSQPAPLEQAGSADSPESTENPSGEEATARPLDPQPAQPRTDPVQGTTDSALEGGSPDAAAAPQTGTGAPRVSDGKININTATHGELTDLPGIGDTLASRIIDYRAQNGGFSRIEDIRNVSGIGERRYEAIQDLITVG